MPANPIYHKVLYACHLSNRRRSVPSGVWRASNSLYRLTLVTMIEIATAAARAPASTRVMTWLNRTFAAAFAALAGRLALERA